MRSWRATAIHTRAAVECAKETSRISFETAHQSVRPQRMHTEGVADAAMEAS
ncbi:hypothetical protein BCR33DRAFT_725576 [Rhizoclosmatium globosum]|uniref:Uncharacterized protein n=1 Tax=Rhizoclosmatium globosum TaxID=329046 RepID=A0A1Y2AXF9_9FUNG|nr:hypothetical protein BCR33DRAFT_725576 [Rhizoclosmatium globosum]|eukprot:ORY27269.1 hypothetical protein BCR33DRAFT_725576 [Rhizoclosmatium globosum]